MMATSLAIEFAKNNKTALLDVDVECPNDHLLLSIKKKNIAKFISPYLNGILANVQNAGNVLLSVNRMQLFL